MEEISQDSLFSTQRMTSKRKGGRRKEQGRGKKKALSSTEFGQKKKKSDDEEASAKIPKLSVGGKSRQKLRWLAYILF